MAEVWIPLDFGDFPGTALRQEARELDRIVEVDEEQTFPTVDPLSTPISAMRFTHVAMTTSREVGLIDIWARVQNAGTAGIPARATYRTNIVSNN